MFNLNLPHKLVLKLRQIMVYIAVLIILILLIMLFKINIVGVFTVIFLMIVACLSKFYKRFTSLSVGFEFVTPVVIIFAYKLGILFSLVSAFIMLIGAGFISTRVDFPSIASEEFVYLILILLTKLFSAAPFVPLAVIMIILRNLFLFFIGWFFLGRNPLHMLIVVFTDMFLNILVVNGCGIFFLALL